MPAPPAAPAAPRPKHLPIGRAEGGRLGCRRRWDRDAIARGLPAGPRVVRLDSLTEPQRRLVLALVAAAATEGEAAR